MLTISPKGWVVIPAELRKKYGLKPGTRVQFVDYGGRLTLAPLLEVPIHQAEGMLAGPTSLTQALLRERAQEGERLNASVD
ncbi:MAG TPA: AbrB/MazE/SpoVT family DNA-binding domain-containing protein [Caldilineaceae bacterium]|nr:AbrB/MazE/SpoVT family DNA-binding domain-containing protein [Caldilineaceae bacterium]